MVLRYLSLVKPHLEAHRYETAFFHQRAHFGAFYDKNPTWRLAHTDPITFLRTMQPFTIEISTVIIRSFKTPANSVPSKRYSSTQSFIHNKVQNRPNPIRVYKLIFMYMNHRGLDYTSQAGPWEVEVVRWGDHNNENEFKLEDQLRFQEPAQVNKHQVVPDIELLEIEPENEPEFNHYYSLDPNYHFSLNPYHYPIHFLEQPPNEHLRVYIGRGKCIVNPLLNQVPKLTTISSRFRNPVLRKFTPKRSPLSSTCC
jgi:hypothetical protein